MILQFRLKAVWKISKPYCMTLKQWLLIYVWKIIVCTTEARDETNDMKISSFSSPPYKVWGSFFRKDALHGRTNFLNKFMGGCFRWGRMITPCKGGSEWLRGFKGRAKSVFLSLNLTWVIDKLFEKSTPQMGDWIWKTTSAHCFLSWGFYVKPLFFAKKGF